MAGNDAQKAEWLPRIASGEIITSFALTEPGAGSDSAAVQTRAVRDGEVYRLSGSKRYITNADKASLFTVMARTGEPGARGVSAFLVPADLPGVSVGKPEKKMGQQGAHVCDVNFDEAPVPAANRLGEEGEGFKIAMFALEQGRYTVAAGATGVIRASRDASVAYALERETFGTKIANHQLVKQKIAEMEADYQMSHLLWLRAGWLKNEGRPNARATSLAKWQATVRSEKAASMAIEVHGANGYSNDYPVERYLRNCKAAVIYEGTRDIHTLMQADWALGLKGEKPARRSLPPYRPSESRDAVAAD
jgi:glutaryl-CoA dehydrogenase (non-decarboxylating)